MRWIFVSLVLAAVVLTASVSAHGATAPRTDAWPLHHGLTVQKSSRGPRVAALQYLIRIPRPAQNHFTKVVGTLKRGSFTRGIYDKPTLLAVEAYKFRIGVPAKGQCNSKVNLWRTGKVTPYFMDLLRGKRNRPFCWVAIAQHRIEAVASGQPTAGALRLKQYEIARLGVHETCGGSCNRGPTVDVYQRFFGLIGQAWCAIFQNYGLIQVGLPKIGAPNPFYVPSIAVWAQHLGYLNAKARVGSFVIYLKDNWLTDSYHIGYVTKVTATGYSSIEGNYGDAVRQRYTNFGDRYRLFVYLPYLIRK